MQLIIRTLIVDDEPLAIRGLKIRLQEYPHLEIIGSCHNGREAVKVIKEQKPDLVFLDIQMPGFDGFSVLKSLIGITELPLVIFVTAFDQYAIDAFKAHALDYLLKPVDEVRLKEAIVRAEEAMQHRTAIEQNAHLIELIENIEDAPHEALTAILDGKPSQSKAVYDAQLRIKDRGYITIVDVKDIDFIDAAGDYMCIHVGDKTHILRETMKHMIAHLDPKIFQRIHRSTIVNLDMVQQVRPYSNGECFLKLSCGKELKVSRSYKEVIGRFL